ncbi:MAG: hypothetical protein GY757_57015 [bacterium]|nr:hypothetical protein [bacterium]
MYVIHDLIKNITPKREQCTVLKPGTELHDGILKALSGLSTLQDNEVTGEPAKPVGTLKLNVLTMDEPIKQIPVNFPH